MSSPHPVSVSPVTPPTPDFVGRLQGKIVFLESEVASLTRARDDAVRELNDIKSEAAQWRRDKERMQAQLSAANNERDVTAQKVAHLQSELQHQQELLASTTKTLNDRNVQTFRDLSARNSSLEQQLSETMAELQRTQERLRTTTSELTTTQHSFRQKMVAVKLETRLAEESMIAGTESVTSTRKEVDNLHATLAKHVGELRSTISSSSSSQNRLDVLLEHACRIADMLNSEQAVSSAAVETTPPAVTPKRSSHDHTTGTYIYTYSYHVYNRNDMSMNRNQFNK